jgi:hypothetical protein
MTSVYARCTKNIVGVMEKVISDIFIKIKLSSISNWTRWEASVEKGTNQYFDIEH